MLTRFLCVCVRLCANELLQNKSGEFENKIEKNTHSETQMTPKEEKSVRASEHTHTVRLECQQWIVFDAIAHAPESSPCQMFTLSNALILFIHSSIVRKWVNWTLEKR